MEGLAVLISEKQHLSSTGRMHKLFYPQGPAVDTGYPIQEGFCHDSRLCGPKRLEDEAFSECCPREASRNDLVFQLLQFN